MEVDRGRTVPLELARQPEMVWGLGLSDLPWLLAGGLGDGWLWHLTLAWSWKAPLMAAVTGAAVGLAWGRWEGERVPARLWQWLRWTSGTRIYLP
ncbi:MAG: hypothetical protein K6U87_00850 [Firmicutes bacterium]|nr:hypothetical protein [Bacillota bacterium]